MKTPLNQFNFLEFQDPVLLCFLLYGLLLTDYSGFLRISILVSMLHECGHVLMYWIFLKKMPHIRVSATGFCMKLEALSLSAGQRAMLAVAGPATNVILALLCLVFLCRKVTVWRLAFLAANILLGLFNLLPIPPLDGAEIVSYLFFVSKIKLHFLKK